MSHRIFRDANEVGGALGLPAAMPTPSAEPGKTPEPTPQTPPQPPTPQPVEPKPEPKPEPKTEVPNIQQHPQYKAIADKHAQAMRLLAQSNPALHQQISQQLQPRNPNGQFAPQTPPQQPAQPFSQQQPQFRPADPFAQTGFQGNADPYANGYPQELTPQAVQLMVQQGIQTGLQQYHQEQQKLVEQQKEQQRQAQIQQEYTEASQQLIELQQMKGDDGNPVIPEAGWKEIMAEVSHYFHDWNQPGAAMRNFGLVLKEVDRYTRQAGSPEAIARMRADAEAAARQTTLASQPAPPGGPGPQPTDVQQRLARLAQAEGGVTPGQFLRGKT